MVYYFKAKASSEMDEFADGSGEEAIIYMGKDKVENDPLIKHSHPRNIWFHVDNHSSAHLYLQLTEDQLASFTNFSSFLINPDILEQIAQLTKANSIKGNKLNNITVIYTPVENLVTNGSMDIGTVTFRNLKNVKRVKVTKRENVIINKLNKTKTEKDIEVFKTEQAELVRIIERKRKDHEREKELIQRQYAALKETNKDPYADLFSEENMKASSNEMRHENWVEDDFM